MRTSFLPQHSNLLYYLPRWCLAVWGRFHWYRPINFPPWCLTSSEYGKVQFLFRERGDSFPNRMKKDRTLFWLSLRVFALSLHAWYVNRESTPPTLQIMFFIVSVVDTIQAIWLFVGFEFVFLLLFCSFIKNRICGGYKLRNSIAATQW